MIFISGGGDIEQTQELDSKFFSCLSKFAKILYVPVAMGNDDSKLESCFDWFSGLVVKHQGDKELDFQMLLPTKGFPDLAQFKAIYIGGGNTYTLLSYIKKHSLMPKLRNYLESGGIIYGGSAGAIVLGKDIRTVEEENINEVQDCLGMDILDSFSVLCHFDDSKEVLAKQRADKYQLKLLALKEESGAIFSTQGIEYIGTYKIFDKSK